MRLIDADALREYWLENGLNERAYDTNDFLSSIDDAPTVEAHTAVRHGRWVKDGEVCVCSECGEEHAWDEYRATYCEDCGAKMDGGTDND